MKCETYYSAHNEYELVFKYCGYEECAPSFITYPHTRSEYIIHYVTKGSGTYTCENRTFSLSKGDLFLIIPNQLINYQADPQDPFHFSWFAISGNKAARTVSQMGFSENRLVQQLHRKYAINEPIQELVQLLNSKAPTNDFEVHAMLYAIISNIVQSYQMTSRFSASDQDLIYEHVSRAKAFIKYNYMHPITVTDVVNHVGLERSYFSKIFHKYTGSTAQNYILDTRLHHSRLLLERTDYTVRDISLYVGIRDEYYFSRAFRKKFAVSPSQYRQQIRRQTEESGTE